MNPLYLTCVLANDLQADTVRPWPGNFSNVARQARLIEAAGFDALVCVDPESFSQKLSKQNGFSYENYTLSAALAAITKTLKLIIPVPTSCSEPYNVARRLAAIDHISNGRTAWIATPVADYDTLAHYNSIVTDNDPYERAGEFIDVTNKLWNSWSAEAIIIRDNGRSGVDARHNKPIQHVGKHFSVMGPLDVPRPPYGPIPIAWTDISEAGKKLAVRHASCIFTDQPTMTHASHFKDEIHQCLLMQGRKKEDIKIITNLTVTLTSATETGGSTHPAMMQETHQPERPTYIGHAEGLLNFMKRWHDHKATDGFNLIWSQGESGLIAFAKTRGAGVVNLLQ